eukprot:scaffold21767_cov54-Phaeocystis_antarctica.AAC.4
MKRLARRLSGSKTSADGSYGALDVPMARSPGAACVAYVPEAQGSCFATVRTPYAYEPRACRTYRVPWHHRRQASGPRDGRGAGGRAAGAAAQGEAAERAVGYGDAATQRAGRRPAPALDRNPTTHRRTAAADGAAGANADGACARRHDRHVPRAGDRAARRAHT